MSEPENSKQQGVKILHAYVSRPVEYYDAQGKQTTSMPELVQKMARAYEDIRLMQPEGAFPEITAEITNLHTRMTFEDIIQPARLERSLKSLLREKPSVLQALNDARQFVCPPAETEAAMTERHKNMIQPHIAAAQKDYNGLVDTYTELYNNVEGLARKYGLAPDQQERGR